MNGHNHRKQKNLTKTTKKDCTKALLTKQTKDKGITCGYYEFAYTLKNKDQNITINTCYTLDQDSFDNQEKVKKSLKEFGLGLYELDEKDITKIRPIYINKQNNVFHHSIFIFLIPQRNIIHLNK